jgi:hypothetical protein
MSHVTSPSVTEPTVRGEFIVAEYGKLGEAAYRRVSVNLSAGTITFFRCHTPRRFMATGPDAECSCQLAEVRGIGPAWFSPRGVGSVLEVVTPTGRARLPHAMSGFHAVREVIEEAVAKSGRRLRWYETATAQQASVLAWGAAMAAGVIWGFPAMTRGAIAATIWTIMIGLLAACSLYSLSKRTWW